MPWGLLPQLRARAADVTGVDALPVDDPETLLATAAGRPVVVVCRDTHRSTVVRAWLEHVVRTRPDTVVVDLGWPSPTTPVPPEGALIRTHGAGPASTAAVADLLADA